MNAFSVDDILVGAQLTARRDPSRKERLRANRLLRGRAYSANLVVDIGGTCLFQPSLTSGNAVSGQVCGLSGVVVGQSVNLKDADTFCQVYVGGQAALVSGPLVIGVQCSDSDVSGTYTDPTSGLTQLPTYFSSGGNLVINSGSTGGILNPQTSGQSVLSGFIQFAAFQRPNQFARLVMNSGFYLGTLQAGFVSQLRTTGSGGGASQAPATSGPLVINV